ncbi:hypothetical protein C4J81_17895 [Deltaproteobacteria bacterium Smac51]|nr:hypothetical protein C4J81_17895 [Deltaproteobacteria bacterium Smac51]
MLNESQEKRLLDMGLTACHRGLPVQGRRIFKGLLAVRPNLIPAQLGVAFSHLVVGDFAPADLVIQNVLAANPQDEEARALLALSLRLQNKGDEARPILEALAAAEGPSARLAKDLLG